MADLRLSKTKTVIGIVLFASVFATTIILNNEYGQSDAERIASAIDIDNGDLEINWSRYESHDIELSETLEIKKSGTYHLTGSLINQNIVINATGGKVKLILDNVFIDNSTGPAIVCYDADDLVIELIGENILSDGKVYASNYEEDVDATIYSKGDLTFQGDGTLTISGNYQDGIVGKDDLKINSGTYNVTAVDDAILGKDSVYVTNGDFTINARGDGIRSTNETTTGKGFVLIKNGSFDIAVGDDGIHAFNRIVIYDGNIDIAKSYEGIEAQNIYIAGGNINITASDDGINAGGGSDATSTTSQRPDAFNSNLNCILDIAGGDIYINASGDGVDSNGYIHFNGGTVIVDGPTNNGNGALDAGISITQTGGTVIAVGASGMAGNLGSSSSIYNVSIYFTSTYPAGTEVKIKNSDNETIIKHTSAKSFSHMAVGTAKFERGETYTIYIDGTKYETFTISSITTTVGNNINGNGTNGNMAPGNTPSDNNMAPGDGTPPDGNMPPEDDRHSNDGIVPGNNVPSNRNSTATDDNASSRRNNTTTNDKSSNRNDAN